MCGPRSKGLDWGGGMCRAQLTQLPDKVLGMDQVQKSILIGGKSVMVSDCEKLTTPYDRRFNINYLMF